MQPIWVKLVGQHKFIDESERQEVFNLVLTYLAKMLSMSAKYELILKITFYFKVCFKFFSFILTV